MEESKPLTHLERIKAVNDLAVKNNIPVKKVFDMYNKVNNILYEVCGEKRLYRSDIEDVTFQAVINYFSRLN